MSSKINFPNPENVYAIRPNSYMKQLHACNGDTNTNVKDITITNNDPSLVSIEIDIGNGNKEYIEVPDGFKPRDVAEIFCKKRGLGLADQELLTKRIELVIEEDRKMELNNMDYNVTGIENVNDDDDIHVLSVKNNVLLGRELGIWNRLSLPTNSSENWEDIVKKKLQEKKDKRPSQSLIKGAPSKTIIKKQNCMESLNSNVNSRKTELSSRRASTGDNNAWQIKSQTKIINKEDKFALLFEEGKKKLSLLLEKRSHLQQMKKSKSTRSLIGNGIQAKNNYSKRRKSQNINTTEHINHTKKAQTAIHKDRKLAKLTKDLKSSPQKVRNSLIPRKSYNQAKAFSPNLTQKTRKQPKEIELIGGKKKHLPEKPILLRALSYSEKLKKTTNGKKITSGSNSPNKDYAGKQFEKIINC